MGDVVNKYRKKPISTQPSGPENTNEKIMKRTKDV